MAENNNILSMLFGAGAGGVGGDSFYGQPAAGGGMLAEQALGLMSPHLGMLSSAYGLNEKMMRMLGGSGLSHYGGSMFQPPNHANVLLNNWQHQLNTRTLSGVAEDQKQFETRFMTNMYRSMGFDQSTTAERVQRDAGFWLSPMKMFADAMMGPMEFSRMQSGMSHAARAMGVRPTETLFHPLAGISPQRLERAYGTSSRSAIEAQMREREELLGGVLDPNTGEYQGGFNQAVMGAYEKNISGFGGLSAGGVGDVMAYMGRGGGLSLESIKTKSGAMVQKVKSMSQAVGAMQEVFGGPMQELLQKMDALFGGNAAGMDPEMIKNRVLQMKHTAAMTGTSLAVMGEMTMAGQQYGERMGLGGAFGAQVALNTQQLIGPSSGDTLDGRLDTQRYRSEVLKFKAGAAGSTTARYAGAAYLTWLDRNYGGKGSADTQAEFMNLVDQQGGGLRSLAGIAGVSASEIITASQADSTLEFLETSSLGGDVAISEKMDRVKNLRRRYYGRIAEKYGVSLQGDAGTLSRKEILAQARAAGVRNIREFEGELDIVGRGIGRRVGFTGARAQMSVDELMYDLANEKQNRLDVEARTKIDASLKKLSNQRFGARGLIEAINEVGATGELTVRDASKALFGLDDTVAKIREVEESDEFKTAMAALPEERRRRMRGMERDLVAALDDPGMTEEQRKKVGAALATADLGQRQQMLEEMFYETTERGKKLKIIKEAGLEDAFTGTKSYQKRKQLAQQAAFDQALQESMTTGEGDQAVLNQDRLKKMKAYLTEAADGKKMSWQEKVKALEQNEEFTEEEREKFKEAYQRNRDTLGLKGLGLESVLNRLASVLEDLVTENGESPKLGKDAAAAAAAAAGAG